mmetsp:Transcript_23510/g.56072  ORF Transcript_23510/g.56072 Transcript_23510/m.56072 type:complete len:205 (+) Transcript_23510:1826-2440(+)
MKGPSTQEFTIWRRPTRGFSSISTLRGLEWWSSRMIFRATKTFRASRWWSTARTTTRRPSALTAWTSASTERSRSTCSKASTRCGGPTSAPSTPTTTTTTIVGAMASAQHPRPQGSTRPPNPDPIRPPAPNPTPGPGPGPGRTGQGRAGKGEGSSSKGLRRSRGSRFTMWTSGARRSAPSARRGISASGRPRRANHAPSATSAR